MRELVLAACLGLAAVFPAEAADCPLLRAVYEPIDREDGKAYSLRHAARDISPNQATYVLRIREERQAVAYDFSFAYANGYGGASLIFAGEASKPPPRSRDGDPGSSIFYFDANLARTVDYADPQAPAPAYIFMPELGRAFWYWGRGGRRFVPPAGMWKLMKCE